ncbi:MAG TPA: uL15 family ribosomal protein [archaeon]|nr:uL15 family ribosomal protein [archaeon]
MPTRNRKVRRLRGSRTHGWGIQGQHRRHKIGGHGKAGTHKHKWTPPQPKFAGKTGFKPPSSLMRETNTINVGELDELIGKLITDKKLIEEQGKVAVNLIELGYGKLLGGGKVTRQLVVKVPSFSESAEKKISEAGGEIVK